MTREKFRIKSTKSKHPLFDKIEKELRDFDNTEKAKFLDNIEEECKQVKKFWEEQ